VTNTRDTYRHTDHATCDICRNRPHIVCAVFDSLSCLLRSSSIAANIKGRLYCALVLSVMYFNAEVLYGQSQTLTLYTSKAYTLHKFRLLWRIVAKTPEQ